MANTKHSTTGKPVLKRVAKQVLKESKKRGWSFFCFAALPDCFLGKPMLKRNKYLKTYMAASGSAEFLRPDKNKGIFSAVKKPGQLAVVHVNKYALSCIRSGGYSCGYLLTSIPDRHWFTAALVLSRTKRPFTDDDLEWLQSVSWRFMQYRDLIKPYRVLHPVKRRKLLKHIAKHGYTYKQAAKALGLSESAVKRQLENLRADYRGCEELKEQEKADASNQLQLLGLAAKHDQI